MPRTCTSPESITPATSLKTATPPINTHFDAFPSSPDVFPSMPSSPKVSLTPPTPTSASPPTMLREWRHDPYAINVIPDGYSENELVWQAVTPHEEVEPPVPQFNDTDLQGGELPMNTHYHNHEEIPSPEYYTTSDSTNSYNYYEYEEIRYTDEQTEFEQTEQLDGFQVAPSVASGGFQTHMNSNNPIPCSHEVDGEWNMTQRQADIQQQRSAPAVYTGAAQVLPSRRRMTPETTDMIAQKRKATQSILRPTDGSEVYHVKIATRRSVGEFYCNKPLMAGDCVIIEADRGENFGTVIISEAVTCMPKNKPCVLRISTPEDYNAKSLATEKEQNVLQFLRSLHSSNAYGLQEMNIDQFEFLDVECQMDLQVVTVFYTAPNKFLKFRPLLALLFKVFKCRVWMSFVKNQDVEQMHFQDNEPVAPQVQQEPRESQHVQRPPSYHRKNHSRTKK